MANSDQAGPGPEVLLAGAGRPRPLPVELRAHLERALLGRPQSGQGSLLDAGGAEEEGPGPRGGRQRARSLPDEARGRLETSLSGPPPRATARRPKWLPSLAAAAALVALAAIGLPSLLNQSNPQRTASKPNVPVPRAYALRGPNPGRHQSSQAPLKGPVVPGANSEAPPSSKYSSATVPKSTVPRSSGLGQSLPKRSVSNGPRPKAAAGLATGAPTVHSVNPRSGPAAGGNWVAVNGGGFSGGVVVMFGTALSPRVKVVSAQRLNALAPAHRAGPVDVVVKVGGRASPVGAGDRYRFNGS